MPLNPRTGSTILIATDGSPAAQAAVNEGLGIAAALGGTVRLLHAASPLAEALYAEHPVHGPPATAILARDPVLGAAAALAREAGVEAVPEVIAAEHSAHLGAAIAGIADGIDASMIVVGSRGRGAVAGTVLGSVSLNVLRSATVPVLVVHAREPEPTTG